MGLYFTGGTNFFQFVHLPHILKQALMEIFKQDNADQNSKGILSSFEANSTAIGELLALQTLVDV